MTANLKSICIAWIVVILISCSQFSKPRFDVKADEAAIRAVLDAQQIAWNNGDMEAFMEGYWNSDSLQFMSFRGVSHGWKQTFENYKKAYPDRATMGTLSFEILEMTSLSEINFVVMGKFHLIRESNNLDGAFTLIFKKINGKWVAIYDHTAQE